MFGCCLLVFIPLLFIGNTTAQNGFPSVLQSILDSDQSPPSTITTPSPPPASMGGSGTLGFPTPQGTHEFPLHLVLLLCGFLSLIKLCVLLWKMKRLTDLLVTLHRQTELDNLEQISLRSA